MSGEGGGSGLKGGFEGRKSAVSLTELNWVGLCKPVSVVGYISEEKIAHSQIRIAEIDLSLERRSLTLLYMLWGLVPLIVVLCQAYIHPVVFMRFGC